ncbi:MAG TPA: uroporphyrinogen-III C-methyltransferase [Candidatus Cybelea sp.]|jgi:uroporphyrinogen III methyltransferase/synthase|nr:uroporphyrinogen-III C-methyltransferase [Candidatus Cybelea sp.]
MMAGRVALIGAGPGDPGLLTLRGARLLREAEVLLYDALASDAIVALAPQTCERIYVGKRAGDHAMPQDAIEALAIAKARAGRFVVRLKGGDPFVFGRGGEEAEAFRDAGVPFEIVPGISSALAAPAYAGIPVTHRDFAASFTVVTGHEDPAKPASTLDWERLADPTRTLVILMGTGNLRKIAARLVEHGLAATTPVAVVQDGTRPTQRTVLGTLATIAQAVADANVGSPAVIVVGEVARLRERLHWFDTSPFFGKRVAITRAGEQSESFARALLERGAEPVIASTIAVVAPDDPDIAEKAIEVLPSFAWLIFTSRNGVDAFFARLAARNLDARVLGHMKVAAIGERSAERLQTYGVVADVVPETFVAEAVAEAVIERAKPGERVLLYRAQEARDVLPRRLEAAGLSVTIAPAYKTIVPRDPGFAEKIAGADVLTFTSASTVRGFTELLGGAKPAVAAATGKCIACIGPITEEAARASGLHVDVVASRYTTAGLLHALGAHFSQSR